MDLKAQHQHQLQEMQEQCRAMVDTMKQEYHTQLHTMQQLHEARVQDMALAQQQQPHHTLAAVRAVGTINDSMDMFETVSDTTVFGDGRSDDSVLDRSSPIGSIYQKTLSLGTLSCVPRSKYK
jgi:hypothetical protein